MKYRHEWKHEINRSDRIIIRERMRAVARPDPHAVDGVYKIRSLYFDNVYDKALREKIDGINNREKFRIRYYNGDLGRISLEKKSKVNGLCGKRSAFLTAEETDKILQGDYGWMRQSENELIQEFYGKIRSEGLKPMTIVDYTREPFIYGPGNVRVTIDSGIRTGLRNTDFLTPDSVTIPVMNDPIILEVKWDAFLPDTIRAAAGLTARSSGAFSKYAACRQYE